MFGLDKKYIDFILKVLNTHIKGADFYIFGSRAKENYKEYSDIDIAIDNHGKVIHTDVISKINIDFSNSTIPYEIDIIDLNNISNSFKSAIKNDLKIFTKMP